MPPSPHSKTSYSSAHKDSNLIAVSDSYTLGEYTFTLQTAISEGERVVQAHCSGPEGNAAKGITVSNSTQVEGWYVEANDTSADVYVKVKESDPSDTLGNLPHPISYMTGSGYCNYPGGSYNLDIVPDYVRSFQDSNKTYWVSDQPFDLTIENYNKEGIKTGEDTDAASSQTVLNKPVYVISWVITNAEYPYPKTEGRANNYDLYSVVYGKQEGEEDVKLVARFAIDLGEAGGYPGGGDDWDEEGDYDSEHYPDPSERDPDDPTYTLNLNVIGALSGRHNDPLHDTSYSYIPADKATKKPYGCGGDGGHGGGGGGGASTVVVRKFATNRADSKDITVTSKRHGYGSGGGKGGKGGDGIILIYY